MTRYWRDSRPEASAVSEVLVVGNATPHDHLVARPDTGRYAPPGRSTDRRQGCPLVGGRIVLVTRIALLIRHGIPEQRYRSSPDRGIDRPQVLRGRRGQGPGVGRWHVP